MIRHEAVRSQCKGLVGDRSSNLLECDTDIIKVLSKEEIERAFDLKEQFRYVDHIFERVFQTAPTRA